MSSLPARNAAHTAAGCSTPASFAIDDSADAGSDNAAPDSIAQKTDLLDLAAEMHMAIARHLDNSGLLRIRRVCRQLEKNTLDVFAERFFTTRRHIVTAPSLHALRDITARPALARHIQEIELVTVTINIRSQHGSPWQCRALANMTRKADIEYSQQVQETKTHRLALLKEVVQNLAKLPLTLTLKINSHVDWRDSLDAPLFEHPKGMMQQKGWKSLLVWQRFRKIYGLKAFCEKNKTKLWLSNDGISSGSIGGITLDLMTAISEHPTLVKQLEVGFAGPWRWWVDSRRFLSPTDPQTGLKNLSWANLATLRMGLDPLSHQATLHQDFVRLLRSAVNVTSLDITSYSASLLPQFWNEVAHLKLHHIGIGGADHTVEQLLSVVKSHQDTLKQLRLDQLSLTAEESECADFFRYLSQNLNLEYLRMQRIYGENAFGREWALLNQDEDDWFEFKSGADRSVSDMLKDVEEWARFDDA